MSCAVGTLEPFLCISFFLFLFYWLFLVFVCFHIFSFSFVLFNIWFFRDKCSCIQVKGYAMSHTSPFKFPISVEWSFNFIYILRTMCNLSLGIWKRHTHTLCPKILKMHILVIFATLADLKTVIWISLVS